MPSETFPNFDKKHLVKMKLIAICRVRNEADIIEAFVRHHAVYFNKLLVLDDGSCDGTYETLQALQAEGLPLVILQEPIIGYEQSRQMSRLLQIAVHQFGADWIAPLDADEFVEPDDGMTLTEILAKQKEELVSLGWTDFVWPPENDDEAETNPVVRLRRRLLPRPDHRKLLIPASLVDEKTQISQGNHDMFRNGRPLAHRPLESIALAHFPIRSVGQYASKIAIGYLQYSAMPKHDRNAGFHYREPFQVLMTGGLDALKIRMPMDSRRYSDAKGRTQGLTVEPQNNPLRYQGGALKFPSSTTSYLQNILHCAEAIARERSENMRELSVARQRLNFWPIRQARRFFRS